MMIGGAVLNAAAFTSVNYLAKYLAGDGGQAGLDEKTRHDKALEAYEAAQARYSQERTTLLDWIETNRENKAQAKQNFTTPITPSNSTTRRTLTGKLRCPRSQNFLTFINQMRLRSRASFFLSAAARSCLVTRLFVFFELLRHVYNGCEARQNVLQPQGYWKGTSAINKLAEAANVPEDAAKELLIKQALWHIFLPAPRHVPRPKFDVATPSSIHQADLLFLPHDKLPHGGKIYKYALTVVDIASRYKEAEPLTLKDSAEVAKAFHSIYRRSPLTWPQMLQVDPGCEFMGSVMKEMESH